MIFIKRRVTVQKKILKCEFLKKIRKHKLSRISHKRIFAFMKVFVNINFRESAKKDFFFLHKVSRIDPKFTKLAKLSGGEGFWSISSFLCRGNYNFNGYQCFSVTYFMDEKSSLEINSFVKLHLSSCNYNLVKNGIFRDKSHD